MTSDVSNSRVNESYRTYTRNAESVYPYSNRGGRASAHYPSNFNSYRYFTRTSHTVTFLLSFHSTFMHI